MPMGGYAARKSETVTVSILVGCLALAVALADTPALLEAVP